MNAQEFKEAIRLDAKAIVAITADEFVSVVVSPRGFDCRLIRSLEDDSDASELVAEYSADNFSEIVRLARQALKEWRGTVIQYV